MTKKLVLLSCLIFLSFTAAFAAVKPSTIQDGWIAGFGTTGSALTVAGGYERAIDNRSSVVLETGYGIGNNFMFAAINSSLRYKLKTDPGKWEPFIGIGINYSDYSKKVTEVPGINNIEKGGAAGIDILVSITRDKIGLDLGYDSRSGLLAGWRIKL